MNNLIVRYVKVDRTKTPEQMLEATGRRQYTDADVVKAMPRGDGDEGEVFFFKLDLSSRGGHISNDDMEKEYELRGLKPADPYKLSQVNVDDPAFADEHPNSTHWKDTNGRWCFALFHQWDGRRRVRVYRGAYGWNAYWWFAGLRK
ncbi:MAG: hypothetical protein AAB469_01495 [Patescibacteria group bacterium]